jgi:hypothetical protein
MAGNHYRQQLYGYPVEGEEVMEGQEGPEVAARTFLAFLYFLPFPVKC